MLSLWITVSLGVRIKFVRNIVVFIYISNRQIVSISLSIWRHQKNSLFVVKKKSFLNLKKKCSAKF